MTDNKISFVSSVSCDQKTVFERVQNTACPVIAAGSQVENAGT